LAGGARDHQYIANSSIHSASSLSLPGLNRVDLFRRVPSDLRKYRQHTHKLIKEHGSILNFIVKERLFWPDLKQRGAPFEYPGTKSLGITRDSPQLTQMHLGTEDIKILYNDWPYGVDDKIVHLVIWTKFDLEEDPATSDLTIKARKEIDDFVNETFRSRVEPENVRTHSEICMSFSLNFV
jgi:hypothetical protein